MTNTHYRDAVAGRARVRCSAAGRLDPQGLLAKKS